MTQYFKKSNKNNLKTNSKRCKIKLVYIVAVEYQALGFRETRLIFFKIFMKITKKIFIKDQWWQVGKSVRHVHV